MRVTNSPHPFRKPPSAGPTEACGVAIAKPLGDVAARQLEAEEPLRPRFQLAVQKLAERRARALESSRQRAPRYSERSRDVAGAKPSVRHCAQKPLDLCAQVQ